MSSLVTISDTILSLGMAITVEYYAWVKAACSLVKERAKLALSLFFWWPSPNATRDSRNGAVWRKYWVTFLWEVLFLKNYGRGKSVMS